MKNFNKFTYGDSVIVKETAPIIFNPGKFASVYAVDQVTSENEANRFGCKMGDWIYGVEFEDGVGVEVPERFLDKDLTIVRAQDLQKSASHFCQGYVKSFTINLSLIEFFIYKDLFEDNDLFLGKKINGKLCCVEVRSLLITNTMAFAFETNSTYGVIEDFQILNSDIKLKVAWQKSLLNYSKKSWTSFEINLMNFWWVNIPDSQGISKKNL